MNNAEFTKNIFSKIKNDDIKPTPRLYFTTKKYVLFFIAAIGIAITATFITLFSFIILKHDWFAAVNIDTGIIVHTLETIPYSILLIIALFIFIVTLTIKNIHQGYRYQSWKRIAATLLISIIVGVLLLSGGIGKKLHYWLSQTIPIYEESFEEDTVWQYPEQGLLSGVVTNITPYSFTLVDDIDSVWTIQSDKKVTLNSRIKIIGTMQDGTHFTAERIFPWETEE